MTAEAAAAATVVDHAQHALAELTDLMRAVDVEQLAALQHAVVSADRIFSTGAGRSGLVARAIAMRMMHLGLQSYAVGEVATPAIGEGDLLIAYSARGGANIVAQESTARSVGATVFALTASAITPVAAAADAVVEVPARTRVPSHQHAGSLFEQGCLILGDALCRAVQEMLAVPTAALDERHANLY